MHVVPRDHAAAITDRDAVDEALNEHPSPEQKGGLIENRGGVISDLAGSYPVKMRSDGFHGKSSDAGSATSQGLVRGNEIVDFKMLPVDRSMEEHATIIVGDILVVIKEVRCISHWKRCRESAKLAHISPLGASCVAAGISAMSIASRITASMPPSILASSASEMMDSMECPMRVISS